MENEVTARFRAHLREMEEALPGIREDDPGEVFLLAALFRDGDFLMLEDPIRFVYLLNDTAESFLVPENVTMTGTFRQESEDPVSASLSREGGTNGRPFRYVLAVRQGDLYHGGTSFVLFFTGLHQENHFYRYGRLGHFWLKGDELLRQVQYKAELLRDKRAYLGVDSCTDEERKLAWLSEYPPLSGLFFPACDPEYLHLRDDPWDLNETAADVMEDLAGQLENPRILRALEKYHENSTRRAAGHVASLLRTNAFLPLILSLTKAFESAGSVYPERPYKEEDAKKRQALERKACRILKSHPGSLLFYEEPYLSWKDEVDFSAYVIEIRKGLYRIRTRVFPVSLSEEP